MRLLLFHPSYPSLLLFLFVPHYNPKSSQCHRHGLIAPVYTHFTSPIRFVFALEPSRSSCKTVSLRPTRRCCVFFFYVVVVFFFFFFLLYFISPHLVISFVLPCCFWSCSLSFLFLFFMSSNSTSFLIFLGSVDADGMRMCLSASCWPRP